MSNKNMTTNRDGKTTAHIVEMKQSLDGEKHNLGYSDDIILQLKIAII